MADSPHAAIPAEILNRKGARTTALVPANVRLLLNAGRIESANLCEWLIVDHAQLARTVFSDFGWDHLTTETETALQNLAAPTAMKRTVAVGAVLANAFQSRSTVSKAIAALQQHASDTVRSWACAMIGQSPQFDLSEKLTLLRPLASDTNMGVREIAWMAARPLVSQNVESAIELLIPWVSDSDHRVRRFASEVTRPRGVWCQHIGRLKECPELALPLLDPLRADDSKYVCDSVANWLNDASKSQEEFVLETCRRWLEQSPVPSTIAITKRALRTLTKTGTADLKFLTDLTRKSRKANGGSSKTSPRKDE